MSIDNEKLAQVFINNLGNKLTAELANGMISEILRLMPQHAPAKDCDDKKEAAQPE